MKPSPRYPYEDSPRPYYKDEHQPYGIECRKCGRRFQVLHDERFFYLDEGSHGVGVCGHCQIRGAA